MLHNNWEADFFRGAALDMWRRAVTPEQTQVEVEFLYKTFNAKAESRILDVPCGNGRHSVGLAAKGCVVTGVDQSTEFIAEAKRSAHAVTWLLGDMLKLPFGVAEFDGVFCFGNSFCYLDATAARAFLASIARILKPGGRFVIETGMAAESILPTLQKTRWFRLGDLFMLSSNDYDARASRLDIEYTFIQNGKTEMRPASSYVLTVNEMCRMHQDSGLRPVDLFGSVNGDKYQLGSQRLIFVSERTAN